VVVFQDEISAEDTGTAVMNHRLEPYIYTHEEGQPWPTLRQMIDSNKRLSSWLRTRARRRTGYKCLGRDGGNTLHCLHEDFSCVPNRGGTGKPFLLNHRYNGRPTGRQDTTCCLGAASRRACKLQLTAVNSTARATCSASGHQNGVGARSAHLAGRGNRCSRSGG
jgi:hypothetical protein